MAAICSKTNALRQEYLINIIRSLQTELLQVRQDNENYKKLLSECKEQLEYFYDCSKMFINQEDAGEFSIECCKS